MVSFGRYGHNYFFWPLSPRTSIVKVYLQQLSRVDTKGKFMKLEATSIDLKIIFSISCLFTHETLHH